MTKINQLIERAKSLANSDLVLTKAKKLPILYARTILIHTLFVKEKMTTVEILEQTGISRFTQYNALKTYQKIILNKEFLQSLELFNSEMTNDEIQAITSEKKKSG